MGMRRRTGICTSLLLVVLLALPMTAGQFHVRHDARVNGKGTISQPWQLQVALDQPREIRAGDTIWIHAGRYNGTFESHLQGTSKKPIIVRAVPGDRVVIDGGCSDKDIFRVGGRYTWFWGLEITSTCGNRVSTQNTDWPTDVLQNTGVTSLQEGATGTGCKFINLVVHDAAQGFSLWKDAVGAEIYGCLVYYNGWVPPNKPGAGHGIYTQNESGARLIAENVVWANFSHGIHAYGSSHASLNNIALIGNIVFGHTRERNILLGGGVIALDPVIRENYTFDDFMAISLDLGYAGIWGKGSTNAVVTGNYFVGRFKMQNATSATVTGNTFYGYCEGFSREHYPENVYALGVLESEMSPPRSPDKLVVVVRPNKYEKGRAHIVVYNWDRSPFVDVDPGKVLKEGDRYIVRDVQNYFGDPVASGVYNRGTIRIPTGATQIAPKVGNDPRALKHTGPEFGAFILQLTPR